MVMKKRSLRIGLFTDVYYPSVSGVVVAVDTLKKALELDGNKVFIITMNSDPKSHQYIKKNNCLRIPGIPTHIYDYTIRISYPIKAVKMIKSLNLDIIHSHTEFGMGLFAKSMAKKLNIPIVHTYHTLYDLSLNYITKGFFPKTSKKILRTYMKFYFSNTSSEIIVPSIKAQNSLEKFYNLRNSINVIPNGIDLERFNINKIKVQDINKIKHLYNIKNNDFIIMWVGRLGYEKSIDTLIDGMTDIIKLHKNVKLMLVGGGPEYNNLNQLVRLNNLTDYVIFTDKVPYNNIPIYYQIASIVVTASHYETQGLTIVEGFSSGKPAICVKDDSFTNVVINDYNGMYFRNKKDYAKIINSLIDNPLKLKDLSNNAKISSNLYSLNSFASNVTNIYYKSLEKQFIENDENNSNNES